MKLFDYRKLESVNGNALRTPTANLNSGFRGRLEDNGNILDSNTQLATSHWNDVHVKNIRIPHVGRGMIFFPQDPWAL